MILAELEAYSPALFEKPRLVAFSKADLDPEAAEIAAEVARELGIAEFHVVSAVTGEGVPNCSKPAGACSRPDGTFSRGTRQLSKRGR